MLKTIATAAITAALLIGGAGVAGASTGSGDPDTPATGSAAGSSELLSNTDVQMALLKLLVASGSAIAKD